MATSGTWAFNLDLPEIVEEAYERIGKTSLSGYHYRTARRSLDMLMLEWQNEGLHLWTVKNASQALTSGTASYTLDPERVDLIEASLRANAGSTSQNDLTMRRMSISEYAQQTNKLTTGRPVNYFVERAPDAVTVYVWPVPDSSSYVLNYWYMERVEDSGRDGTDNMDVPVRFLPALTAGLAYQLALKTPDAAAAAPALLMEYERQYRLAAEAHRNKADLRLVPRVN